MRQYMPPSHRAFIGHIESHDSIRDYIIKNKANTLKPIYNSCLKQLHLFRTTHLNYAVEYIHKKVANPKGTGGTPFIQWLKQLTEETENFYL